MNNHLVFATSFQDAQETMTGLGLAFEETVWVLNAQLLGDPSAYTGHVVHYSDLFRMMPAFVEAVSLFGDGPPPETADYSI